MKLTLKVFAVLTFLIASATVAYAEVPDVSKWSCPNAFVQNVPDYGVEVTYCDGIGSGNLYVKVSGELVYVHEHRTVAFKTVYYNALKTNEGNWGEVVNKYDLIWEVRLTKNRDAEASISDDNGVVVAKRTAPLLKK